MLAVAGASHRQHLCVFERHREQGGGTGERGRARPAQRRGVSAARCTWPGWSPLPRRLPRSAPDREGLPGARCGQARCVCLRGLRSGVDLGAGSPPGHGHGRPRPALIQETTSLPPPPGLARPPARLPASSLLPGHPHHHRGPSLCLPPLSPHFPSPPPSPRCPCLLSACPWPPSVCFFQPPASPSPSTPPHLHLLPSSPPGGGPSGWGSRGDKFEVFIILPPSNMAKPVQPRTGRRLLESSGGSQAFSGSVSCSSVWLGSGTAP